MNGRIGVLVMAYGTPGSPAEVEEYYTRIRHGHPPTPELLADLQRRYQAIGGVSPLAERTAAQVAGLTAALAERAPGRYDVRFGAKYTEPTIETVAATFGDEVDAVIGLALTPHFSTMGTGNYHDRARASCSPALAYLGVERFYDLDGFAALQATRLRATLDELGEASERARVLFTAHSLPEKVLANGDPYPDEVADSGARIAAAANLDHFSVAWQSAGRTRDPWIGPDILAVLRDLASSSDAPVVVCPVGFVADHLEVLYDLDVEAQALADELGLTFRRTASLNDDPAFLAVLAEAVEREAASLG